MNDKPFKVEAISIVDHIHRTLTAADSREAAHDKLSNYHDLRFNSAMRKYQKTARKLGSAQEGSVKHESLQAQMQHHLATAKYHNNMFDHHVNKANSASYGGYQDRANQKKDANHTVFQQNLLRQKKNVNKNSAIFKPKTMVNNKPVKPIIPPRNKKIVTPLPVQNTKPLNSITNKLGKVTKPSTNLKKPIHIQAPPKPKAVKQAAKLNIKAQPTIKPIKPVKIKPVTKLPRSPVKMRATPV